MKYTDCTTSAGSHSAPPLAAVGNARQLRTIIGCTRTIRTAVALVEWLRCNHCWPHSDVRADQVHYAFKNQTDAENGWWSADIYIDGDLKDASSRWTDLCRAFVAGAGEVW